METGTRYQFVPYRNTGMQDLMAGLIDLMIDPAANSVPQVRAGTIKAYAVTSRTRTPAAPDVPTVDEAGLPALQIASWHGLWVPKGTPRDIIAKLNGAVVEALADLTVWRRLADLANETVPRDQQTPAALAAWQKAEIEKWWPIIKAVTIRRGVADAELWREYSMAKQRKRTDPQQNSTSDQQADTVYKIVDVVGVSETSWEDAGRNAVETAAEWFRDLRARGRSDKNGYADGKRESRGAFRTRVSLSFKYEA